MINAGLRINSSPLMNYNTTTNAWDSVLVSVVYPIVGAPKIQQDAINNKIQINDIIVDTMAGVWKVTQTTYTSANNFTISLILLNGTPSIDLTPNIGDTKAYIGTPINGKVSPYWDATYVDSNIPRIASDFNINYPNKLDNMSNITIDNTNLTNNQVLQYDAVTGTWKNATIDTSSIKFGGALSADYLLVKNTYYFITANHLNLTLPSSPTIGQFIELYDATNSINDINVLNNGSLILSLSETLQLDVPGFAIRLLFVGGNIGWHVYNISNITNVTADFSSLLNKPTTLSAYGIVDATSQAELTAHSNDMDLHLTPTQNNWIDSIISSASEVNRLIGVTGSVQDQLNAKIAATEKGIPNGIVPLGIDSKINTAYFPDTVLSPSITSDLLASIGVANKSTFLRGDRNWSKISKDNVGLGNVDNTSDVNKPISTFQQTALDLKSDKTTTYSKSEADTAIHNAMLGIVSGLSYSGTIINADTTLDVKKLYLIGTSGVSLTLPTTVNTGDYIQLYDSGIIGSSCSVTVKGTIENQMDLNIDMLKFNVILIYINSIIGWVVR